MAHRRHSFRHSVAAAIVLAAGYGLTSHADAQGFNQFIGFGDSTIDSGYYRTTPPNSTNPTFNADFAIAVTQGAGKATTSPGLVNSEVLAGHFGLSAIPVNQPGGTNYATGDAHDSQTNVTGNLNAVPTATQISNYLAAAGGFANPNALYVISSGGNDVLDAGATIGTVTTAANALIAAAAQLRAAGARFIIVPNLPASLSAAPATASLMAAYNSALWSGLAAAGINFVPADINSVLVAVRGNAAFGITATGPACTQPAGITSGWASLCSTASTISTLVSPDAAQTHLFADNLHLSSAGQQIVGDYEYSLLIAPSMISMLAEAPVKMRAALIDAIDNNIPISQRERGPAGINTWLSGDVGWLKIANAQGFPNDPGTPASFVAGIDNKFANGWLVGLALSTGWQQANFSGGFGGFRQDEAAISAYASKTFDAAWLRLIGSYGLLKYDVNRTVPIGVAVMPNSGRTRGSDLSFAAITGYDLLWRNITHGPIAGVTLQHVAVNGFTEAGGFTALGFGRQTRDSTVTGLGYQAALDAGIWRPFAKAAWNHDWTRSDREVIASLTTIAAPSFSLPAVEVGSTWGTASAGTTVRIADRVTGLIAFTSQFAQHHITTYGGQIGINAAL